jgi:hypothetical protein
MDDVVEAEMEQRDLTRDEIYALSIRAVNQLIGDVEVKRLLTSGRELAESIAVCIRHSEVSRLQDLRWLLDQRELEGIAPCSDTAPRWQN